MFNAETSALLLVDLQNDFCEGGALAVKGGNSIIPLANQLMPHFQMVLASIDWHPVGHISFASTHQRKIGDVIDVGGTKQVLWPDHCVQQSHGAAFHPDLNDKGIHKIFEKGTNLKHDSYSAFYDNEHVQSTGLTDYLNENGIRHLYIMGLATDYCVKFSVLDAIKDGFSVSVIEDGCKGVDVNKGDVTAALKQMAAAGAHLINSQELLQEIRKASQ